MMNRYDLQALARERVRDARVLLANARYAGAYYLAGYAIECALKACIARKTRRYDFPDRRQATDSYTHDLAKLVDVAGLREEHEAQLGTNKHFALNWAVVTDWKEVKRYDRSITPAQASDLYSAVTARKNGVMAWLRTQW